jgi:poly(3-hydroxybutyrate) depolymerase
VRTVRVGWNTTSFKCYIYNNMAFRLKFPANYDATKSYPVLIFFHGKGEFGSVYDNEYQLYLGGQVHGNAVDGGKFNGFLLYPQSQTEFWSTASMTNVFNLIDKVMVPQGLVDPFRVYVNGLSAGGGTTWSFLRRFSKLTAAITPISSASSTFIDSVHRYKFTPIFHFQGGLDTDPHPNAARSLWATASWPLAATTSTKSFRHPRPRRLVPGLGRSGLLSLLQPRPQSQSLAAVRTNRVLPGHGLYRYLGCDARL